MATVSVDGATRWITMSLTPAEANTMRDWLEMGGEPPIVAAKMLYAAVSAVADGRDYQ